MIGFVSGNFRISKPGRSGNSSTTPAFWGEQKSFNRSSVRARTTGTALPQLNTVHSGTVVSVQPFGAFVQLGTGEKYKDGLLHVSCLPGPRVERPEEVVAEGDKVWVKVSDVREDEGKYGLDMRYVHQADGRDLDPFHTKGRLPDTGWVPRGQTKPVAPAEPSKKRPFMSEEPSKPATPAAPPPSLTALSGGAVGGAPSKVREPLPDLDEERKKIERKKQKALEKLAKARRELEEATRGKEKKKAKKKKKEKAGKLKAKEKPEAAKKKKKKAKASSSSSSSSETSSSSSSSPSSPS